MFSGYALDTLPQSESSLVIATSVVPLNSATTAVPLQNPSPAASASPAGRANTSGNISGYEGVGGGVGMGTSPALPAAPPPNVRVDVGANEAGVDVGEVVKLGGFEDGGRGYVNPVASVETGERSAPLPALPTSAPPRSVTSVDQIDHKF